MFVKENPDKKISLCDFYMEQLGFVGNGTETMSRLYAKDAYINFIPNFIV